MTFRIHFALKQCFFLFVLIMAMCQLSIAQVQKPSGVVLEDQPGYGKCYALIIGLNYEDSSIAEAPQLGNAIRDAATLKGVLEKHYGIECTLLTDDPTLKDSDGLASRSNILTNFDALNEKIGTSDSFLLFFAGHGTQAGTSTQTYLVPDVSKMEKFSRGDLLNLSELVGQSTKAKHNLIIIDACYSGGALSLLDNVGEGKTIQKHKFPFPSLQVITSATSFEEARDGEKMHSPFAIELLRELENPKNGMVRAKQDVFEHIQERLKLENQTPQYRDSSLSNKDVGGEYHFLLKSKISKPSDQSTFQMMAGRPGKWWFTETPWLSPGIRAELDRNEAVTSQLDPSDLQSVEKLRKTVSALGPEVGIDREFTNQALAWSSLTKTDRELVVQKAMRKHYTGYRGNSTRAGLRKHLRANLLHFCNLAAKDIEDVESKDVYDAYETAAKTYGEDFPGLRVRCIVDQANWLVGSREGPFDSKRKNLLRAAELLEESQDLIDQQLDGAAPVQAKVEILCDWGTALRKLASLSDNDEMAQKNYEASERKFKEALNVIVESKELSTNNLVAYVYERLAWTQMDQWKTGLAKKNFALSQNLWVGELSNDPDAQHKTLHAKHGLAMVERLAGDPQSAIRAYREIESHIESLLEEDHSDTDLSKRLVNTQERLADAHLFSGGYATAFTKYDQAIRFIKTSRAIINWDKAFEERIDAKYVLSHMLAKHRGQTVGDEAQGNVNSVAAKYLNKTSESNKSLSQIQLIERIFSDETSSLYLKMMCASWLKGEPGLAGFAVGKLRSLVQKRVIGVNKRDEKEMLLLISEQIGQEQQLLDAQLLESVVANGGAASPKYLRNSNESSILTRARLTQTKSSFLELNHRVHTTKGKSGIQLALLNQTKPFLNFLFVRSKMKLVVLAFNPEQESRQWMVADFDLSDSELGGDLEEQTVRSVQRRLALMELPAGTKVFWNDDFLKLDNEICPFSIPQN